MNSANLDSDLNSARCLTPDSHSVNLDPKHSETVILMFISFLCRGCFIFTVQLRLAAQDYCM